MRRPVLVGVCALALALCGCGKKKWEIIVENQSDVPCTVDVDADAAYGVRDFPKGGPQVIATGETKISPRKVTVTRGGDEQLTLLMLDLEPGEKLHIKVEATGKVKVDFIER